MKKCRSKVRNFLASRGGLPKRGHVFYWMAANHLKVVFEPLITTQHNSCSRYWGATDTKAKRLGTAVLACPETSCLKSSQ